MSGSPLAPHLSLGCEAAKNVDTPINDDPRLRNNIVGVGGVGVVVLIFYYVAEQDEEYTLSERLPPSPSSLSSRYSKSPSS